MLAEISSTTNQDATAAGGDDSLLKRNGSFRLLHYNRVEPLIEAVEIVE